MQQLIAPTDAAFEIPFSISQGKIVKFLMIGGSGADFIEFKALPDPTTWPAGVSIADSTDAIDATKKIINIANNVRWLEGPMDLLITSAGTTGQVALDYFVSN